MRNVCFLFPQAWFMMPSTFGGGLGVFGRGGRTWRPELSQQCRKIGSMALQRAGRGQVLSCCVCWGSGAASGVSVHKAAHAAPGAAARAPTHQDTVLPQAAACLCIAISVSEMCPGKWLQHRQNQYTYLYSSSTALPSLTKCGFFSGAPGCHDFTDYQGNTPQMLSLLQKTQLGM